MVIGERIGILARKKGKAFSRYEESRRG